nr:endonuclease/exonuclease/phosphatase family protein [uncultured Cellulosilyticum sp.]
MKLLTLNCHSWQEANQLDKINDLAKAIYENEYDVIALQEVSQHMLGKQFKGQLKKDNYVVVLQEALHNLGACDYEAVWDFSHIGFQVYEEGLCLLSKHPIVEKESFFVSQTHDTLNWKARRIVRATVNYKGEYIDFYSCHLGWWEDEDEPAKMQLDYLNSRLSTNRRSFLLGDFNNNAHLEGKGYDYIKTLGWLDTYEMAQEKDEGNTVKGKIDGWAENVSDLRLDYIFTTQRVPVVSSKVIFNGKNKPVISDHYGIEVALAL